jgi:hypothetical protein
MLTPIAYRTRPINSRVLALLIPNLFQKVTINFSRLTVHGRSFEGFLISIIHGAFIAHSR